MQSKDFYLLDTFLYEVIFIHNNVILSPKSVIYETLELFVYINNFGKTKTSNALVAEKDEKIVSVIWLRI